MSKRRSGGTGIFLALGVGAYFALQSPGGVAGLAAGFHGHGPLPSGHAYTPVTWARAFLRYDHLPRTGCDMNAMVAWEHEEGGAWGNDADGNPLNTTQREPGSWPINSVGVQAYPSWREGFKATRTALHNGLYGGVLAALRAGDNAQAVASAVAASRWGTKPFSADC